MNQLHYIQLAILKKLLFSEGLKYTELKPFDYLENNKFQFHLDKLIEQKYIVKSDDKYKLTAFGKEYANQMDTDKSQMMKQAKISVIPCCIDTTEKEVKFLIYTRLKHPFYGHQGFPSGKIKYGERVVEAAKRELEEETGLKGEPELFMIHHYTVYDKNTNDLLEDKFFYFCKFENPKGKLVPNDEGSFEWVKDSELSDYLKKPFDSKKHILDVAKEAKKKEIDLWFWEHDHWTTEF